MESRSTREKICTNYSYIDHDRLVGSLSEVVKRLQNILQQCNDDGYTNIRIEYDWWDDELPTYYLMGSRLETDDEKRTRLSKNRKAAATRKESKIVKEQKERELLAVLKGKYE